MALAELTGITKSYGEKRILDGLNLRCESGEYLVVLGTSGSGKTTALRLIAGLEAPDSGKVLIDDHVVNQTPPQKRSVAFVFQNDALYPHLTVRQSIVMGLRSMSRGEQQRRLDQACELMDVGNLLDRYPERLSGGELRRAAIAKAIAKPASVRLLDEPLSALDPHVRHGLQESLHMWHCCCPGTTIHVTHDGQEAMRMADRIAVLAAGRIVQVDKPRVIYDRPKSRAVAMALGSLPMCLLPATIQNGIPRFDIDGVTAASQLTIKQAPNVLVEIGFRFECARASSEISADFKGICLQGHVVRQEFLDGRALACVDVGGTTVRACVDDPSIGVPIRLSVAASDIHVFDAESGRRYD